MTIKVTGAEPLARRLRRSDLTRAIAPSQPEVAGIIRPAIISQATTRQMRRAAASNRVRANAASVTVVVGGAGGDRPWAVGAQFGSKRYRQFPQPRRDGYTVRPAVKENEARIAAIYADAIASAFP